MFGSKTEHYIPRDDTPSLFPEEESPEPSKEVPTATVAEHERKVRQANALTAHPPTIHPNQAERDETQRNEKHELIDDFASLPGSTNQFVRLELSGVGEHL